MAELRSAIATTDRWRDRLRLALPALLFVQVGVLQLLLGNARLTLAACVLGVALLSRYWIRR